MPGDDTNNFQVWTVENGSSGLLLATERRPDEHQAKGIKKHKQKIVPRRCRRIWGTLLKHREKCNAKSRGVI
jgi:hypothetical protein